MNYKRIAELYTLLDAEIKKIPVDAKRVAEINHYLSLELGKAEVKPVVKSFWDWFVLPPNWKVYITSLIGVFIAVNSQLHFVPQNIQDALLAAAVSLGFWAVNSTQTLHFEKLKLQVRRLSHDKDSRIV